MDASDAKEESIPFTPFFQLDAEAFQKNSFWMTRDLETYLKKQKPEQVYLHSVIEAKWDDLLKFRKQFFVLYAHTIALYQKPKEVNLHNFGV